MRGASLTFPAFPTGLEPLPEESGRKGHLVQKGKELVLGGPPALTFNNAPQRDSVTLWLIHMQKAHTKSPNEEGINCCLIRLWFS